MIVNGHALGAAYRRASLVQRPDPYGPANGVHFSAPLTGASLDVVATDGHRLVLTELPAREAQPELTGALVALGWEFEWQGPVKVQLSPGAVTVGSEELELAEAPNGYPDWRAVVNAFSRPVGAATLSKEGLTEALKALGCHGRAPAKERLRPILQLSLLRDRDEGFGLHLARTDRRGDWTGAVEAFVPGRGAGPVETQVLLQAGYFAAAVRALESEEATVALRAGLHPVTVSGGFVTTHVMPRRGDE